MNPSYDEIRLVLGDQLNAAHSWYKTKDTKVLYVIAELKQEQEYVTHHIQKVQAFFLAMEKFASALKEAGHHVLYLTLDDTEKYADLPDMVNQLIDQYLPKQFSYQQPDEYRLSEQLKNMTINCDKLSVDTEHFYLRHDELPKYFKKDTGHRLEAFYRKLRSQFNVLMDEGEPEGGKWNYDTSNRNKLKKDDLKAVPSPLLFSNDVSDINKRIQRHKIKTMGTGGDTLLWPVTRTQTRELLDFFCKYCLPKFGEFQDAMTAKLPDKQWSLYHSRISFALNSKIVSPAQVVNHAIEAYRQNSSAISIEQIEGFVRQILGWREFVRGIYWLNMPDYKTKNALEASRPLPDFYWTGKTKMNCLSNSISQSLEYAYAHHIQRLMVTGNFALLIGADPDQVDFWYLGIYIDAIEWVEMPNTRGMSQFADGGIVGSKAYASSGNYIQKMTDYCSDCHYDVKQKTSNNSCPFNSLYWHFMTQHQEKFGNNPRNAMVYKNWDKRSDKEKQEMLERAEWLLNNLDAL